MIKIGNINKCISNEVCVKVTWLYACYIIKIDGLSKLNPFENIINISSIKYVTAMNLT